jgi:SHS2 domain-containing protein
MDVKPYEEVPHTADWALRVCGATLADLFVHAAQGMYDLMGGEPGGDTPAEARALTTEAADAESLLVAWLNELLYYTESDGLWFGDFRVRLKGETQLEAMATGRPATSLKKYIKAATFHNLRIAQAEGGLEATIVFDV